jgi:predicted nucleic acid-binding protein
MTTPERFGLEAGDLVLLDSAPLIYFLEAEAGKAPPEAEASRAKLVGDFLEAAHAGGIRLVASTLAWTEILRGPLAIADRLRAEAGRRLLAASPFLCLEPVDVAIAEEAAGLLALFPGGSGRRLELADSLHLATAIVLGAAAILTNDGAWADILALRSDTQAKKGKGRGLPRVLLLDELLFEAS